MMTWEYFHAHREEDRSREVPMSLPRGQASDMRETPATGPVNLREVFAHLPDQRGCQAGGKG
jgi:hypothetical protein